MQKGIDLQRQKVLLSLRKCGWPPRPFPSIDSSRPPPLFRNPLISLLNRVVGGQRSAFSTSVSRRTHIKDIPSHSSKASLQYFSDSKLSTIGQQTMAQPNDCQCRRWAFSFQKAFESEHLEKYYRKAIQSVTEEDYDKIVSFRHKDDSLACLAGRLFLRQAVRRLTGAEWHEIEFGRTEKGKPYVIKPENAKFGINVSHQGDYTVFASSCSDKVGVDVMRLDMCRGNKTADEYINSMAKSASPLELRTMRGQATEQMKMTVFYRYWCLKEAVLKATGQGIVNDLSRYDFHISPSDRYRQGCFLTSTKVYEDGQLRDQWLFEESFVDSNHVIAVGREKKLPRTCVFSKDPEAKLFFSKVDFDFLLEGSTVLHPLPADAAEEYNNFTQKPRKAF